MVPLLTTHLELLSLKHPRVPPNLEFQIDDAEDIWTFHDQFDYIHIRSLAGAIGDWKRLFQQAHQHLKPGGWIEVQEHEALYQSETGSKENSPSINEWADDLHAAAEKIGKPFLCLHTLESKIKETGFTNVEQKILKVHLRSPSDKEEQLMSAVSSRTLDGRSQEEGGRNLPARTHDGSSDLLWHRPLHESAWLETRGVPGTCKPRPQGNEGRESKAVVKIVSVTANILVTCFTDGKFPLCSYVIYAQKPVE